MVVINIPSVLTKKNTVADAPDEPWFSHTLSFMIVHRKITV